MSEPRFLVVRLGSLGDIVHTFPAVAGLKESFPAAQIIWLTHPRWSFLVKSSSLVSDVWMIESREINSIKANWSRIRKFGFGVSIDYQGLWKSATLPFLARIPRRIGFSSETIREYGVPILYTDAVRVGSKHIADQNGELSVRAGAQHGVAQVRLQVPPDDLEWIRQFLRDRRVEEYVVLSPGGGWRSKCWPAERFGALATGLYRQCGLRSVVNYAPGEESLVAVMLACSAEAKPEAFTGTVGQLMALVRGARCVVAGDTGPLHLADALGSYCVALFGPTDPARNGLYFRSGVELRASGVESTYKRHDEPHPSLLRLSVEEVFDAVRRGAGA